jgi:hypothetical protein
MELFGPETGGINDEVWVDFVDAALPGRMWEGLAAAQRDG